MGIFTSQPADDNGEHVFEHPNASRTETKREQTMRRAGKRARDELDKATHDPKRLGNRGRGSR